MELYIGGFCQGKLEYVKGLYPSAEIKNASSFEEIKCSEDKPLIWNHFHLSVKQELLNGNLPEKIEAEFEKLTDEKKNLIIISDEVGNGIVPMEKEERCYRETVGHLLVKAAKKSEKVVRIVCSIPQRIK